MKKSDNREQQKWGQGETDGDGDSTKSHAEKSRAMIVGNELSEIDGVIVQVALCQHRAEMSACEPGKRTRASDKMICRQGSDGRELCSHHYSQC